MELTEAAKLLSRKAIQIRTSQREVTCLACGDLFKARSAKAQYCSKVCFAKVFYRDKHDPLGQELTKIKRRIKKLIGSNPKVDSTLKKMLGLVMLAKMRNSIHLPPSSIPM